MSRLNRKAPPLSAEVKTWARIGIGRVMPPMVMDRLRRSLRKARRKAVREAQQGAAAAPASQEQIETHLRALGVEPGSDLLIHSALAKLGPVDGGAETVIRALMKVVGPEATLIMPAYPMPATMYEWMRDPVPFCVETSPSRMGALTEVFRKLPGVRRSAHPTHSVAALGPAADLYTRDHHKALTPCAPGSPFRIHADRGGDILCLGTGVGKITSYHVIEDSFDDYPLPVYLDRRMAKAVLFPDGRQEKVEIVVGNPRLSPWRVDNFKPKEQEFLAHLRRYEALREGRIGLAASHLINGVRFHAMMLDLTAKGITIYHLPRLGRWLMPPMRQPGQADRSGRA